MPGQNIYPNPDNYPVSSFRSPVPPPEVDPDEGTLIPVAYNPAWQQVLLGALEQLVNPATWAGTDEEKTLALQRAETLRLMMTVDIETAPAPYWDNAEDADDQEPEAEQPWYGKMDGLDFKEELGIWVITGFIAYSGQIGAAIAFKTFAPRFALAWKRGGIVAAVRVFIDGVDNGLLDTSGAPDTILEKDYIGDPGLDEHDILMVLEEAE